MALLIPNQFDGRSLVGNIHVGDTGSRIVIRCYDFDPGVYDPIKRANPPAKNISATTSRFIIIVKPGLLPGDPDRRVETAATFTDVTSLPGYVASPAGADGYLQIVTTASLLDVPGRYQAQPRLVFSSGAVDQVGSVSTFQVLPRL